MQLKISVELKEPCTLPIAYHHILQSAIYSQIGGELHDVDYKYDKRGFKLFTFGPIEGRYVINGKYIIFNDKLSFEVRCFIDEIGIGIVSNVISNGIRLGRNTFKDVEVTVKDQKIGDSDIIIAMRSPICVYETSEDKRTQFFNPSNEEFYTFVEDNFIRKYTSVLGEYPVSGIELNPVKVNQKDKYLTKYKGFYIEAWKGIYRLTGHKDYLNFLYNTGLGAKNSQGFGMFDQIHEDE